MAWSKIVNIPSTKIMEFVFSFHIATPTAKFKVAILGIGNESDFNGRVYIEIVHRWALSGDNPAFAEEGSLVSRDPRQKVRRKNSRVHGVQDEQWKEKELLATERITIHVQTIMNLSCQFCNLRLLKTFPTSLFFFSFPNTEVPFKMNMNGKAIINKLH